MIARILYYLTGFLPCRLIYVDQRPYMERYYLGRLFGLTFYIHRFISADGDRHLHDHPWRAVAFVLSGGYTEERLIGLDNHGPLYRVCRRRWYRPTPLGLKSFHRISQMQPGTWTLFIHAKRRKGWGFLEPADDAAQVPQGSEATLTVYTPFIPRGSQHKPGWQHRVPRGRNSAREPLELRGKQ